MPVVMVNMVKTDNIETKRDLVKGITDVVEKACKVPREAIMVIIKEDLPENVGKGGVLALLDLQK